MKLTELLPQITPLPHTIGMNLLADGPHLAIWDGPGKRVVAMFAPPDNHTEEDDANAIYYHHAANVLPELVAVLREACEKDANAIIELDKRGIRCSNEALGLVNRMCAALERAENIKLDSV